MTSPLTPENYLPGHTSPETAYVVDDYPYGYRLRCKIRYWIETNAKHGDRMCSQTTNPKVAGEVWNKPKKSTYALVGAMYLDGEGHVQWTALQAWPSIPAVEHFLTVMGDHLTVDQLRQIAFAVVQTIQSKRAYSKPEEAEEWLPVKDRVVAMFKAKKEEVSQ